MFIFKRNLKTHSKCLNVSNINRQLWNYGICSECVTEVSNQFIDFKDISTYVVLFYAKSLDNHVHCISLYTVQSFRNHF